MAVSSAQSPTSLASLDSEELGRRFLLAKEGERDLKRYRENQRLAYALGTYYYRLCESRRVNQARGAK